MPLLSSVTSKHSRVFWCIALEKKVLFGIEIGIDVDIYIFDTL